MLISVLLWCLSVGTKFTNPLQGGMLSLEEQIIDATTEEGQAALKEFEEQEKAAAAERRAAEPAGDPE
jgi:cell division cycle protein 37